jgi:hypothetical protein
MEAARRAEQELQTEIVIISRISQQYEAQSNPPPCPSVALGSRWLVKDGTVTFEDLKSAIVA